MRVGASRIFRVGKFHQPFGASELAPGEEKSWRIRAVEEALALLKQKITAPTISEASF